jgi:hypothetical protein
LPLVIQPSVIDVIDWPEDPGHPQYPEGAREKSALFPPAEIPFDFLVPGRRYLFKLSDPRYPEQFWAETIAYIAGSLLGVEVPPAYVAFHSGRQVCGALIEWFFVDGEQSFVAGGDRLQRLVPEYDRKKGSHHSFQLVHRECARAAQRGLHGDWLLYWGQAVLFDALIGNTDRHQDNWGFLAWTESDGTIKERLAPLFDNGTSLGMERHMEHVATWDSKKYDAYLKRGCHHMKWTGDDAGRSQHFELVENLVAAHPRLRGPLREMLEQFSLDALEQRLTELCRLDLPIRLSASRLTFTLKLMNLRYQRLCAILS